MVITFSEIWWQLVLLAIFSYAIGNINFALIISRSKKTDVRKMGSGNPGTLNMSRNFGLKIGGLTLLLDMLKGGIPSLIGYLIMKEKYIGFIGGFDIGDFTRFLCGIMVIVGHIFPVTMNFKGGKGIASTLGIFLFSQPIIAAVILLLTFLYIYKSEWGSMGSLLAVAGLSISQMAVFYNLYTANGITGGFLTATYLLILSICLLTWTAHRKNIVKLLAGEEHHTSVRALSKKRTSINKI
jgi:glycerol-3-phosphate acyltransferase PlsY